MNRYICIVVLFFAGAASAALRYVPPPAPSIVDGKPIAVVRESHGSNYIVHLARATPADSGQFVGEYVVDLHCTGAATFSAQLSPRIPGMGVYDEELLFFSIPADQEKNCQLSVVDRFSYPWSRVFKGSIESIPELKQ